MLIPKLVTTLRGHTRAQFTADLSAGVIVGIVALPLAIAFAIASGVSPERGLTTAIKFIPHAVTIGFTSGIALIILSSQVRDFLGLRMATVPASFVEKW